MTESINAPIKYIDLFCGIGSFHYSFEKFGWQCVMACDIDKHARSTYINNYKTRNGSAYLLFSDICEIPPETISYFDILCAGFPCQAFSNIGAHKGFDDKRGTLFFQTIKFIKYHRPKFLVFENVTGLLTSKNKEVFDTIKTTIEQEGYIFNYIVLKCSDFGIPQMRKRVFMICANRDYYTEDDLIGLMDFSEYKRPGVTLSTYFGKNFKRPIAFTIRCGGRHSPIDDKHNWDGYWIDGKEYRLTIQDTMKLQGFSSDKFRLSGSDTQKWKQLGNTIPTCLTEIVGKQLQKYLY
jgi:DNA (cytosine-5)-methyltransferase 1